MNLSTSLAFCPQSPLAPRLASKELSASRGSTSTRSSSILRNGTLEDFLLALGKVCGVVVTFLFFGVFTSVSSSSLLSDDSSRFLFPFVLLAVGVEGAVAALRGASSSSDELSEELLLSLALAAGVVLLFAAAAATLPASSSSSELLSLDEDSAGLLATFADVLVTLGVAALLLVAAGLAGGGCSSESELSVESELLSSAFFPAAALVALPAAGPG